MESVGEINMTVNHAVKPNKVKSKLHIALLNTRGFDLDLNTGTLGNYRRCGTISLKELYEYLIEVY